MELFALIVKQDGGMLGNERNYVKTFLSKQLTHEDVDMYMALFDDGAGPVTDSKVVEGSASPSVKDSVKILNICKKINRTLNQVQKIVVLMRLYELVNSDKQFTAQRMNIVNTVAEVFRIPFNEFSSIEQFIRGNTPEKLAGNSAIMVLTDETIDCNQCGRIISGFRDTLIMILHIESADIYFIKYVSDNQMYLNGLPIAPGYFYIFANGSSLRSGQGIPLYYTDIISKYREESRADKISLSASDLTCRFEDGTIAINKVSFSLSEGNLTGILGASGSGKTTLLNILSGNISPTEGRVRINSIDVHEQGNLLEGVIGYVPQDDMLIENLTVFSNLYYAAALSFSDKTKEEITLLVEHTLTSLGLIDKRDLKVGSPLNKVISGGQRKRLNIALELIREPSILFLDEPTSGLSSRDSENIMDLLRELTLRGKMVVTVIHQPSSEIFKMFDKVVILDQGGYLAYFGNPVESIIHFKTLDSQINSTVGECPSCGNVNPELIFQIMEAHVVDEFGRYTGKRKVSPGEWNSLYKSFHNEEPVKEVSDPPVSTLKKPGFLRQLRLFLGRDLENKSANRQYLYLTLLEAPLLGFILSYIIRYIADPSSDVYIFADNENIPIYIFMSIIVALFLGLIVSAEEIFHDRILLKREKFLNLSRGSYLFSKVILMITISAIQVFLFLIVANPVLGIKGLFANYFIVLFTTAFCANMIGLNISASLNSAITIYIVIPLLMIPMMVLSGAMFPFDKLNRNIGSVDKVPVIAELMPTRWTYEALMVSQFKDNRYGKIFYSIDKERSIAIFNLDHRLKELDNALSSVRLGMKNGNISESNSGRIPFLRNELIKISEISGTGKFAKIDLVSPGSFTPDLADEIGSYLSETRRWFDRLASSNENRKENFLSLYMESARQIQQQYDNTKLKEIITKYYEPNKSFEYQNRLIQNYDPVYQDPEPGGFPAFRTHFFAPVKYFLGRKTDTIVFNVSLVLVSTMVLYLLLYFNAGARLISRIEKLKFPKRDK
ncbi:MAG: ATP-binding cassette domain-containing protein [Bacteroidales bacterium]|nr:ATP-binding cassette domain-containing protein [Bacteroidales bacterium]